MKRLVIGILAHVDAGKTTLSEGLLFTCGAIKQAGRVDHGDAFLDTFALERSRGITIFSKQAVMRLPDAEFTLLDTPGHVDFSTEMERTLQVLDYAVLVISGTDGVQSHTQTLWQLLARHHVPTFLFVNKMDLDGADRAALMITLNHHLSDSCVDFSSAATPQAQYESLATCDETLLEQFLNSGKMQPAAIAAAIQKRHVFPCYFGSALKMKGVEAFLDGLKSYTICPTPKDAFGARVFKIAHDEQGNRLTYIKITGGSLPVKASLQGGESGAGWAEKVNQIRVYSGNKFTAAEQAVQGMVCAVTGLTHTYPGEGLGAEPCAEVPVLEPVLTYRVDLPPDADAHTALRHLRVLEEEDPQLHVVWNEALQEIHMQLMGEVQLDILKTVIAQRFGMQVEFGQGNIVYKETITGTVEGVGHFEPLRHYAEVHLLLQAGARGSGLHFGSTCSEDVLDKNWQRLILTHLKEKTHLGVLAGAPITDMKIILAAGKAHLKHTEGGDFRQATYRAVRQGLMQAESILLEPWYAFRLEVPAENVGRAMADIQRMNGTFTPPDTQGETAVLTGTVPVAAMQDYSTQVTGYTRGKGHLTCTLQGYAPCHNTEEVVSALGYNCTADIANTADSVFCAHGAGFTVKWNEVPAYMHLDSFLPRSTPQSPAEKATVRRAAAYCATLAEDKELLAIFERTYGPVKRNIRTAFSAAPKSSEPTGNTPQDITTGPEYLLVDGYNIIFAWEDLSALAKDNLEAARQRLINILCNYRGFRQCELILVFDAYKVKGNPGEVENVHNISVVYTKEAETADMYIEKVTHKLGKKYRVRVATSDGMEQMIILGHGALRVSATMFRTEVDAVEKAIRSFLEQ